MTDYYALGKMDAHGVAPLKEAAAGGPHRALFS